MRAKQAKNYGKSPKPPFDDGNVPEHLHQLIAAERALKDPEMLNQLLRLSDEYHARLRAAIGENEHTHPKTILELLRDPSPIVVLSAISSKHATVESLGPLKRHKNEAIRSAAATRMSEILCEQESSKSKSPAS
jgi:hypothetical protein